MGITFQKKNMFAPKHQLDWKRAFVAIGSVATNALFSGLCFAGGSHIFVTASKKFHVVGKVLQMRKAI